MNFIQDAIKFDVLIYTPNTERHRKINHPHPKGANSHKSRTSSGYTCPHRGFFLTRYPINHAFPNFQFSQDMQRLQLHPPTHQGTPPHRRRKPPQNPLSRGQKQRLLRQRPDHKSPSTKFASFVLHLQPPASGDLSRTVELLSRKNEENLMVADADLRYCYERRMSVREQWC